MSKTYEVADSDLRAMLESVIEAHHPLLREAHVHVAVLLVYSPTDDDGHPKSPPLTVGGWPAQARVRITSLRDRALGMADALIELDGHLWPDKTDEEQRALLDHELTHLTAEIGEDEARTVKSDACDRPVLTLRKHDVRFEGFLDVMKRNGKDAPERELLEGVVASMKQYELALPDVSRSSEKPKTARRPSTRSALGEG